jgi:hypothetical protein
VRKKAKPVKKPTKKAKNKGGKAGRQLKFKTPAEMQVKIDEYFANPPKRKAYVNGKAFDVPCTTITGLTLHLGFRDKGNFYDQAKRAGFEDVVATARSRVEHEYEKNLQGQNVTGAIFALKNFGWKDGQTGVGQGAKGNGGETPKPTLTIPLDITPAEATRIYMEYIHQK